MIDIQVRSETGHVLAHGKARLDWAQNTIASLDPSAFPMLSGICPFEDTVFNSIQRQLLVAELDRLPVERQGPWAEALRSMCQIAADDSHRYVWLLGD